MTAIEMKIVSRWVDGMGGTMLLAESRKNMFALENFAQMWALKKVNSSSINHT